MLGVMGVDHTIISDNSDVTDSPLTGHYETLPEGGTTLEDAAAAINAKATVTLMPSATRKTVQMIENDWEQEVVAGPYPLGITATDEFLERVSALSGVKLSPELEAERGRAVDAMADSHPYVHGKRVALVGDPDVLLGMMSFLMEMGVKPVHVLCTNGDKKFKKAADALLAENPYGSEATVHIRRDMWHLRSLMFTDPVDLLIGPSSAKFLWRDTRTPFVRVGFPLFDRHHLHRRPIIGYEGAINLLTDIVNTVLEEMDREAMDTTSFDLIR
jgi:nitrogenase molybdenum-iron protein beta chain